VLEANQQAAALAGRPAAEIIGRPSLDFVEPRRAAFVRSLLQRLDLGGSARSDDVVIERPDGSVALVEASGTDIQVGDERLRLVILRDITERKRAEAKLRESEDRFRRLAENAQDLIYRYQLLPTPGFEYVSPAATAITGYTPEEHYADPELGVKIVHPEDRPIIEKMLQAEEVPEEPLTVRWMHKSGRTVWTEQRNVAIRNQSGKVAVIEGIARDVTERRKLEEQLRQAQKMEAVGQLAGGIAHDFNNLLTVITGYADMALPKLHRSDPLRQDIEEIRRAGQRAAALTRQLLAFSRRQIVTPGVLDLNEIVAEMENLLRRTIGENIELVTVPAQALGRIKADPGQIEQIIMNLVLNSRDAMAEGGKLTIETSNADLDATYVSKHVAVQPGRYIMLAVSDTGCGMNEETQSRIFEPFFTTKEQGKGTGLGLATIYGIVKQCGGTISVYSELGHGTTFMIFFPEMTGIEEAVQPEVAPARVPGGIETVLVVEDDEMVRRLSCLVLKEKGYNVLEARHGGEALLTCERHLGPIHLMVTDVIMPQMGGRELAQRLAPLHPEMKVLYLSGYASNAIVHQGTLLPGVAFLQKPFAPGALTRKVREVLDASAKGANLRTGL